MCLSSVTLSLYQNSSKLVQTNKHTNTQTFVFLITVQLVIQFYTDYSPHADGCLKDYTHTDLSILCNEYVDSEYWSPFVFVIFSIPRTW